MSKTAAEKKPRDAAPELPTSSGFSLRVYLNGHEPVNPETAELIRLLVGHGVRVSVAGSGAEPDAVKRMVSQAEREQLARRGRAVTNPDGSVAYPVESHQDAENALAHIRLGHGNVKDAKRMLRRVAREEGWHDVLDALGEKADKAMAGNPAARPDGRSWSEARVSPSRVQGGASPAVDDHGAGMPAGPPGYEPGPRELAYMHPSMRMAATSPQPLLSARTDANPHPRDLSGAAGVSIALSRLGAYSAAGAPDFRMQPSGNPAMRQGSHIAPIGPSNGGHSLSDPQSHAVALKASDRVAIMREHMFGNGPR